MRDLVEHPSTGLTLDFFHRDDENPSMYLRMDEDTGRVAAVHWPGSGLEAHKIVHAPSPEHGYQAEYLGNAAQAVGHQVAMEQYLPTGIKPDLLISGPQAVMSAEVQRSHIGVPTAKRRTTQALLAGTAPTWFTDTRANPKWLGHVPGVRFNPEIPWDTVPRPRTVSVAGVRHILERNCRNWPGSPCPRHSRGCSAWHPDHTPSAACSPTTSPNWSPSASWSHGVQDLRWPQAGPDRLRREQGPL
jgi:hypothetical protein